jgi:two-component system cell cycle sensor histidine kinase/response regulator CckA
MLWKITEPGVTKSSENGAKSTDRLSSRRGLVVLGAAAIVVAALASWILLRSGIAAATLAWLLPVSVVAPGVAFLFALYRRLGLRPGGGGMTGVLRGAFESLPSPRIIIDPGGKAIYANAAFYEIFGKEHRSPVAALEAVLGHDTESTIQIERVRKSAMEGRAAHIELRLADTSGEPEWRNVSAMPLDGYPGYVLMLVEDTTSRRDMERIIREEQSKLVDFLDNSPVGFYSVDGEGRFIFANQTFAGWLGRTPEDILSGGHALHDFIVTGEAGAGAAYDPFGGDGSSTSGEVLLRGPLGRTFQAQISQSVVRTDHDTLRTRSVVRDLSPQREWEKALRDSEQQFQRIFEDAPVGIALIGLDGRIVQCNQAFKAVVTIDRRDLAGIELTQLVTEDDREEVTAAFADAAAGKGSATPVEVHPRDRSDSATSLYLNAVPDEMGNIVEIIAHCLDTTEQRNLEVQFAQSQKMQAVGQLAGGMAHDFNNLLTAMIGFCDLLLLRHRPGEQSFADIMQIKQNANRAASLVRQLLAFSRQQTLKPVVLAVTDVLAELGHLLRRLVGENIEVKMVHGRDLGLVRFDQGQMEQVIINLVVNARDAMPDGGVVMIRTSNVAIDDPIRLGHEMLPPGDFVLIEVIDEGEGISKANIGRIFEPFFSTKEVGAGTGLGLSTVYGIVKQTNGFVFVDSEPGQGAKFKVFLPRHQANADEVAEAAGEADKAEPPQDLTGAGTVLLVEDEDPVRLFSARALRNKGYTVLEAESGEAAMNHVVKADQAIDLLITDVVMPRMDGPSLIREVRQRRPEIKVICISGYAEDAFRKKLDHSADIHFLPKPFSLNQLAGKVKEVLRAPAA